MKCNNCIHKKSTEYIKGLLKLKGIKVKGKDYISVEDMGKVGDRIFNKAR